MGWGWAGVIWLYSLVTYFPLDILKFAIRYILSGKAWDNLLENKVCFVIIFLNDGHFNTRIMSSITLVFNLIVFFFFLVLPFHNRLPLLQRKTMEKKREKHNGQLHRGPCMVFNHLKPATFSLRRVVTGSFQR